MKNPFRKKTNEENFCDEVRKGLKGFTTFYGMFSFMEGVLRAREATWKLAEKNNRNEKAK